MNKNKHYAIFLPNNHGTPDEKIKIRLANPSDAIQISKIETKVYGNYPESNKAVIKIISQAIKSQKSENSFTKTWVALKNQELIGYSKIGFRNSINNEFPDLIIGWYLTGITIHPNWRRVGTGRLLTKIRINWLKDKTNEVYYWSNKNNITSELFHKDFGFKKIKSSIYTPNGYSNKSWDNKGFSNLFKAIIK